jgi:hypothetical protein
MDAPPEPNAMSEPVAASALTEIVRAGERIYAAQYQAQFESNFPDQYAVIDVATGKAFVAPYPEDAIANAQHELPDAKLHLIRIGAPSAFQLSYFVPHDADLARVL